MNHIASIINAVSTSHPKVKFYIIDRIIASLFNCLYSEDSDALSQISAFGSMCGSFFNVQIISDDLLCTLLKKVIGIPLDSTETKESRNAHTVTYESGAISFVINVLSSITAPLPSQFLTEYFLRFQLYTFETQFQNKALELEITSLVKKYSNFTLRLYTKEDCLRELNKLKSSEGSKRVIYTSSRAKELQSTVDEKYKDDYKKRWLEKQLEEQNRKEEEARIKEEKLARITMQKDEQWKDMCHGKSVGGKEDDYDVPNNINILDVASLISNKIAEMRKV